MFMVFNIMIIYPLIVLPGRWEWNSSVTDSTALYSSVVEVMRISHDAHLSAPSSPVYIPGGLVPNRNDGYLGIIPTQSSVIRN